MSAQSFIFRIDLLKNEELYFIIEQFDAWLISCSCKNYEVFDVLRKGRFNHFFFSLDQIRFPILSLSNLILV